MKLLALLCASSIVVVSFGLLGQPSRAADESEAENGGDSPAPAPPTRVEKRSGVWAKLFPPYTDAERLQEIRDVERFLMQPDGRAAAGNVVPPMTELLHDQSAEIRAAAASIFSRHLHELGKSAIPDLTQLLEDENPQVRRRAVQALSKIARDSNYWLGLLPIPPDGK
jgi:HEAT repeat protein